MELSLAFWAGGAAMACFECWFAARQHPDTMRGLVESYSAPIVVAVCALAVVFWPAAVAFIIYSKETEL